MRPPTLFGPSRETVGRAFGSLVPSAAAFVVLHRPLHLSGAVLAHARDGTRPFLRFLPQFRMGPRRPGHGDDYFLHARKNKNMVGIAPPNPKPLPAIMAAALDLSELARLTTPTKSSPRHRISNDRLQKIRRALLQRSRSLKRTPALTHRERADRRALAEGERRRNIYIKRSSSNKKALRPDKSQEWYNQVPSFYRGSRRRRRQRRRRS